MIVVFVGRTGKTELSAHFALPFFPLLFDFDVLVLKEEGFWFWLGVTFGGRSERKTKNVPLAPTMWVPLKAGIEFGVHISSSRSIPCLEPLHS